MEKEYLRFYVKTRTLLNIQARIIHEELFSAYGNEVPCLSTIEKWSKRFREGEEDVKDKERSVRPVTVTTTENIEEVRSLIDDDPYITIEELEMQTSLSHGTILRIVSDHLNLRKVTARYVPKHLTEWERAERVRICKENLAKLKDGTWRLYDVVTADESWFDHKQFGRKSSHFAWVARGDPPPTVVRRSRYARKTLFSIFLKSTGPVLVHHVEPGQTIDHQYYIENCLQPVVEEIKKQRPALGVRGIKLHHDNGRPHIHKAVVDYLESEDITIIPHPPYSPDLSPCDFWLFDMIKQKLGDQNDSESLHRAVAKCMNSLSTAEYKKTFEKWI